MKSLFAYGSLQLPEVLLAVIGQTLAGVPAQLEGYRCCALRGRSFPGVRPDADAVCSGILYRRMPDASWPLLDAFEDDFYRRLSLPVQVAGGRRESAEVYVVGEENWGLLLDEPWDLQRFKERSLQNFLRDHS
ncbi:MAG: gamma-glutamylcyclotransferase [Methylococcaceae bacterium]|nr:gamma-glutamylcyclotransferase [Methylococcaceae bacterium]